MISRDATDDDIPRCNRLISRDATGDDDPEMQQAMISQDATGDDIPRCNSLYESNMSPSSGFVRIEPIEVPGYDGDRDGQGEHPRDGTGGPDDPPDDPHGHLVPVPDRSHCYNRPPESVRNAVNLGSFDAQLGVVDGARVDKQADSQRDQEQTETLDAGLEGEHEDLEADGMFGQFEDPDETDDTQEGE